MSHILWIIGKMIRLTWVHFVSETKCFIKIFEFFASQTIGDFLIPVKCFSPIVCNVLHACCLFRFHCLISIIAISLAIIISAVHLSRLIFTGSNRWTLVVTGRFADTGQNYNLRFRSGRSGVPIQIIELGSELILDLFLWTDRSNQAQKVNLTS